MSTDSTAKAAGDERPAAGQSSPGGVLQGVRILDFSRVLAGPFATMMLGDLGAEVFKIERLGVGDETRGWGPPHDERGNATYFQAINRNKRSLGYDLTDPDDLRSVRELALGSDVIVENFRPGLLDGFGLGHAELSAENPALIYCSITGFGRGGGASLPGYDLLVQALGGLMSITGAPGGPPQKVGVALVDVLAGLFATVGILAALRHREQTGLGQRVDVNLLSSLLAALANQGSAYTNAGAIPQRLGNSHPSIAPYDLYATGDGDLVLAVGNDRQFQGLSRVLGAPELGADARYLTNTDRVRNRAGLRRDLERLLSRHGAAEWADMLTPERVPAGVVNDIAGAFALAERLGLDPVVELEAEPGHAVRVTRNPIELSGTPATYRSPPPALPPRPLTPPDWSST